MTWFDHHRRSTKLAAAARKLLRLGNERKAERLYAEAAAEAERAMALVPPERKVTFGVVAMFAHRLWRRAHRSDDAARIAGMIRGSPDLFALTISPQGTRVLPPTPTPTPKRK